MEGSHSGQLHEFRKLEGATPTQVQILHPPQVLFCQENIKLIPLFWIKILLIETWFDSSIKYMTLFNYMDTQAEVEQVKKELIEIIIKHLDENKIPLAKARQLAADFLSALPIKDQKDLLSKLKSLGEKYPEAEKVYVEELEKVEDNENDRVLSNMRDFIKQGNIEQAISTAKTLTDKGGNK